MTRKKSIPGDRILTEVELELMRIIWDRDDATIRDVVGGLPPGRDLAYTSVATIMKILEKKKFLKSQKHDHAHIYVPLVSKAEYESTSLRHLAKNVFQDDPTSMVMKLLNDSSLSQEALQAIKKLVDKRVDS